MIYVRLYVCCTSIRGLFLIEEGLNWGKLEHWRQVTQRGRMAQGRRMGGWASGLASLVKPLSPRASQLFLGPGAEMHIMETQQGQARNTVMEVEAQLCRYQKTCHLSEPQENKGNATLVVARSTTAAQVNEPCSQLVPTGEGCTNGGDRGVTAPEHLLQSIQTAEKERHTILTWRWDVPQ